MRPPLTHALAGVALLVMTGGPALALDCSGALDPAARATCRDPGALAADGAMSDAYARLARAAGASRRRALLEDQRRWLRIRDLTCLGEPASAGRCLADADEARARALSGTPAAGPGAPSAMAPVIAGSPGDAGHMTWHALMFRFTDPGTRGEEEFNAIVDARIGRRPGDAGIHDGGKGTYEEIGTLAYASASLVSIRVDGSEFVEGAAHGLTWTSNVNVDLRTGDPLSASSYLTPSGAQSLKDACAAQVASAVRRDYDATAYRAEVDAMRKDVDAVTIDPTHWEFGRDALTVTYGQDAVASHVEGAFSCRVGYVALSRMARPGAAVPGLGTP